MTFDEAMAWLCGPGSRGRTVRRPGLPYPVGRRFGLPALLTGPRSHIAYTPTRDDLHAGDWEPGPPR